MYYRVRYFSPHMQDWVKIGEYKSCYEAYEVARETRDKDRVKTEVIEIEEKVIAEFNPNLSR